MSTVALVNSGFEADTPQILIPMVLAKRLHLDAYLEKAGIEFYGTPGGPVRLYILPSSTTVWVDEPGAESPMVNCDTLISDIEAEVLISNYLAGELGIIAEDFKRGLWRLRSDKEGVIRGSHSPQLWVED